MKKKQKKRFKKFLHKNGLWFWPVIVLSTAILVLAVSLGICGLRLLGCKGHIEKQLDSLILSLKKVDAEGIKLAQVELEKEIQQTDALLNSPILRVAKVVPSVKSDLNSMQDLLSVAQTGMRDILTPLTDTLQAYPPVFDDDKEKKLTDKLTDTLPLVEAYSTLIEQLVPPVKDCLAAINALPPMHIGYLENKLAPIRTLCAWGGEVLPVVEKANNTVLVPAVETIQKYPPNFTESGITKKLTELVILSPAYLSLLEEVLPSVEGCIGDIKALPPIGKEDLDQKLASVKDYCLLAETLVPMVQEDFIPLGYAVLNDLVPSLPLGSEKTELSLEVLEAVKTDTLSQFCTKAALLVPRVRKDLSVINEAIGQKEDINQKLTSLMNYCLLAEALIPLAQEDLIPLCSTLLNDLVPALHLDEEDAVLSLGLLKNADSERLSQFCDKAEFLVPKTIGDISNSLGQIDESIDTNLGKYAPLLSCASHTWDKLGLPALRFLSKHSLNELFLEGMQFNVSVLPDYFEFAETVLPQLDPVIEEIQALDIEGTKFEPLCKKLCDKLIKCRDLYKKAEKYLPLLRSMLGTGENRTYLLVAQNSAETRGSGGFPGAMGFIRIKDGIMKIEDFSSVYKVLVSGISQSNSGPYYCKYAHSACGCPYFPWVAETWCQSAEERNNCSIDGVISLTPLIIQDLISVTGPVKLSDGTVLTENDAVYQLQFLVYYRYQTKSSGEYSPGMEDKIFAETPKKVIAQLKESISTEALSKLLDIAENRMADRTVMMWMKYPEQQKLIEALGCDGSFGDDPTAPTLGIYLDLSTASKLGWFLDTNVQIEDPIENGDGSLSYYVTLTIHNTLPKKAATSLGWYIVGRQKGVANVSFTLTMPVGGSIKLLTSNLPCTMRKDYMGVDIYLITGQYFVPGKIREYRFLIVTSPEAKEPLKLSITPSLTEYRLAAPDILQ